MVFLTRELGQAGWARRAASNSPVRGAQVCRPVASAWTLRNSAS